MEKERVKTHRQLRGVAEGSWRTPWMVFLSWNRKRQGLSKVQWVKVEGLCSSQERLHAMTNKPWVSVASHNKSVFLFPSSPVNMGFREPSVVCSDQGLRLHTFYGSSRISESFLDLLLSWQTQEKRKIVEVCTGDFRGHSCKCCCTSLLPVFHWPSLLLTAREAEKYHQSRCTILSCLHAWCLAVPV